MKITANEMRTNIVFTKKKRKKRKELKVDLRTWV